MFGFRPLTLDPDIERPRNVHHCLVILAGAQKRRLGGQDCRNVEPLRRIFVTAYTKRFNGKRRNLSCRYAQCNLGCGVDVIPLQRTSRVGHIERQRGGRPVSLTLWPD